MKNQYFKIYENLPKAERLQAPVLKEESETIGKMIACYCQHHHGTNGSLCPECLDLYRFALKRLAVCPFGENKPTCGRCKVHCYKPAQKTAIKKVMRFSGPRLLLTDPWVSFKHLLKTFKTSPEKPRNIKKNKD